MGMSAKNIHNPAEMTKKDWKEKSFVWAGYTLTRFNELQTTGENATIQQKRRACLKYWTNSSPEEQLDALVIWS